MNNQEENQLSTPLKIEQKYTHVGQNVSTQYKAAFQELSEEYDKLESKRKETAKDFETAFRVVRKENDDLRAKLAKERAMTDQPTSEEKELLEGIDEHAKQMNELFDKAFPPTSERPTPRPTPETDAEIGEMVNPRTVTANFARKLERERDEARDEVDTLTEIRDGYRVELKADHEAREQALAKLAAVEAQRDKERDGLLANIGDCGACAEGLLTGSTMHEHVGCVYAERDDLRAKLAASKKALEEIRIMSGGKSFSSNTIDQINIIAARQTGEQKRHSLDVHGPSTGGANTET